MVSPRTPLHTKRYGPSEVGEYGRGVGGGVFGGGGGADTMRRRPVPGGGVGLGIGDGVGHGAKSSFGAIQNNNGGRMADDEEILLQRAEQAILLAKQRGNGMVEMDEREWGAWQRHEAIEREVERRLAERMVEKEREWERERSRKVVVPASSISPSLRTSRPSSNSAAPGFLLPGDEFQPLGESAKSSPSLVQAQLTSSVTRPVGQRHPYPEVVPASSSARNRHSVDFTQPLSPKQQIGGFPEDDFPSSPPAPSPFSRITNSQSSTSLSMLDRQGMVANTASRRASPRDNLSPQPGSGYYPGLHSSLAARSETDLSRLGSDDDYEGSVVSSSSLGASSRRVNRRH